MKTYYVCGTIEAPDSIDVYDLLTKMCNVAVAEADDTEIEVDFDQIDDITE